MKQANRPQSSKAHYYEPGIKHYQKGRKGKPSSQQRLYDWFMRVSAFVMIGFSVLFLLLSVKTHFNTTAVIEEKQQVEQSVDNEKKNLQSLRTEAELLKDDDYVMKLARSRYYMSKDGEMIFSTPEDNASERAKSLNPQQNKEQ